MIRGLKNITIDGKGHTVRLTGGRAIFADDIENVTIRNLNFAPGERNVSRVVRLTNARNVRISNCTFGLPQTARGSSAACLSEPTRHSAEVDLS